MNIITFVKHGMHADTESDQSLAILADSSTLLPPINGSNRTF